MANKLNNLNYLVNYQRRSKTTTENEQIESIKTIANLLLRKIEALEKDLPSVMVLIETKGLREIYIKISRRPF